MAVRYHRHKYPENANLINVHLFSATVSLIFPSERVQYNKYPIQTGMREKGENYLFLNRCPYFFSIDICLILIQRH